MKKTLALIGTLSLLAAAASAIAEGDPQAGAQKAAACGACHGADGNSANPEWPNLANQHASYIAEQLALFQKGVRDNVLMVPMAAGLTEQDRHDLGAWYQQQTLKGLEADPSLWRRGEELYRGGDPARGLPACIACHGPRGQGNGPAKYPAVRAQHSAYTYAQLHAYAVGARKSPGNDIMQLISSKLTDEEMRSLASYLQGLR